jgi:DTW domain-containing protein YfiP
MKLYLLTHERELHKATNTGRLVREFLADEAELIVWRRTEPDPTIVKNCSTGMAALLYPSSEIYPSSESESESEKTQALSDELVEGGSIDTFVIIDATWQEARKIYNKSPYLQAAQKISLSSQDPSLYKLRRNQKPGGLSTVESVMKLLTMQNRHEASAKLADLFNEFNQK